jgi:4-amino-4-deoxy-L-arabinose transferase-like glycosyltransferase
MTATTSDTPLSTDSSTQKPARWLPPVAFALIALGVFLRFYQLGARPLWDDEAFAFYVSSSSLGHLMQSLTIERHPPFFFFLEWVAMRLFGPSETALRIVPALCGTALIYVAYRIGDRLAGRDAGLASAAIVAAAPLLIYHSQEARSSSLLVLGLVSSSWALWEHCEKPTWRTGVVAVLGGWAAMTAHYLGLSVVPLAGLILLLRARRNWIPVLAPGAGIVAGLAALVPLILLQRRGVYGGAISFGSDNDLSLPSAIIRSLFLLGNGGYPDGKLKAAGYGLFGLALVAIGAFGFQNKARRRALFYPLLIALFALTFLRLGGVVLKWPVRDNYMPIVAPGVYLTLAILAAGAVRVRHGAWLLGVVLAAMLPATAMLGLGTGHPNPDYRTAALKVAEMQPDGVLLARAWGDLSCYQYYAKRPAPLGVYLLDPKTSPTIESQVVNTPLETPAAIIQRGQRICVLGKTSGQPGFEAFAGQLKAAGYRPAGEQQVYDVRIETWDRGPALEAAPRSSTPAGAADDRERVRSAAAR